MIMTHHPYNNSKMESFIRSKYESRRWAMDGPPPSDPSVLDGGASQQAEAAAPPPIAAPPTASSSRASHASTGSTSSVRSPVTTRQPQPHQLLSTAVAGRATQAVSQAAAPQPAQQQQPASAAAPAAPAPTAANDLFSLDFHNPAPQASAPAAAAPKKDVKQDILSLFSTPAAAAPSQAAFGQFGAQAQPQQNAWGQYAAAPAAPAQPTSMMGTAGPGMWGTSSGWAGQPAAAAQSNVWASTGPAAQQPQVAQQSLFNTNDIWASSAPSNGAAGGDLLDMLQYQQPPLLRRRQRLLTVRYAVKPDVQKDEMQVEGQVEIW